MINQKNQSYCDHDRKSRCMSQNYQIGNKNNRNNSQNSKEGGKTKSWLDVYKNLGNERYTYFWRNESPFSQHYPILFQVDGVDYNCAEQYYMSQKAELFEDKEVWKQIMSCRDPMRQKSIAKHIKGFNQELWYQKARKIVEKATIAKFSASESLKMILLSTLGTTLVETSPKDHRWGIGMEANDPLAITKSTWRGTNWLGEVLTQVRDTKFQDDTYNENFFFNPLKQEYKGFTRFSLPSSPFSPEHISIFTVENKAFISLFHFLAFSAAKESSEDLSKKVEALMNINEMKKVVGTLLKYNREYLIIGNFYKFMQNKGLKSQLLSTKDTILSYTGYDKLFHSKIDFDMGWLLTYMRNRWLRNQKVDIDSMLSGYTTWHINQSAYERAKYLDNTYQTTKSSYSDTSHAMPIFKTPSAFDNSQPSYGNSQKTFQADSRKNNKNYGDHIVRNSFGGESYKTELVKNKDGEKIEFSNGRDKKRSREGLKRDKSREMVDNKRYSELSGDKRNSNTSMNLEERSEKKTKNLVNKIEDDGEVVSMDERSDARMETDWLPVSDFTSSVSQKSGNVKKAGGKGKGYEGKNETENRIDTQGVYMVTKNDSFSPFNKTDFKMEDDMKYTSVLHYIAFKKADFFRNTAMMMEINEYPEINPLTKILSKLGDDEAWLKQEPNFILKAYQTIMAKDKKVIEDLKKTSGKKLNVNVFNMNLRIFSDLASFLENLRS